MTKQELQYLLSLLNAELGHDEESRHLPRRWLEGHGVAVSLVKAIKAAKE